MTATTDRDDDTVAAVGFGAFMALCLGGVGVVLAAVAVGIDRMWRNRFSTTTGTDHADRVADHRAWLAHDAARRRRYRRAYRDWLLDPGRADADRPVQPRTGTRFGWWLHRWMARIALGWFDFRDGFRDQWQASREAHRRGGGFNETFNARADDPVYNCPVCRDTGVTATGACPACAPRTSRDGPPSPTSRERQPEAEPTPGFEPRPDHDPAIDHSTEPAIEPVPARSDPQQPPPNTSTPTGGPAVTATQGETHADITLQKLLGIARSIMQAEEVNDQAAAVAGTIDAQVAEAAEYADEKGATSATRQALDEARALAAAIRETAARLADLCAHAGEAVAGAVDGMRPALDAQDTLHAAGASGDIVATATSD